MTTSDIRKKKNIFITKRFWLKARQLKNRFLLIFLTSFQFDILIGTKVYTVCDNKQSRIH